MNTIVSICVWVVGCLLISTFDGLAKDHYVRANETQNATSDGSKTAPWFNLQSLINSKEVSSGDTIYLFPGHYGVLNIRNIDKKSETRIISLESHKAIFSQITLWSSDYWTISGVKIQKDKFTPAKVRNLLDIEAGAENIVISDSVLESAENTTGWGKAEWNNGILSGIFSRGSKVKIHNNIVRNINFGISMLGNDSIVTGNLIHDFIGDGLRGLGDNGLFENNVVRDCHSVNENHDDGFQSWSVGKDGKPGGGVVENVILRRNLIIGNARKNNSPKCEMQGIGMFGGWYKNWVIENNIVVVNHWHGITVQGAQDVRIVHNTVVDLESGKPGPAWIRMTKKKGKSYSGNLVANNLAHSYQFPEGGILQLQNQVIRNPFSLFEDPEKLDFNLQRGSRAIDAGMDGIGVEVDFFGNPRPSGPKPDVGAIEFQQN